MTNLKGVNQELNEKINKECMIKKAFTNARETVKRQRPVTRRKIEDIKASLEIKVLYDEYD